MPGPPAALTRSRSTGSGFGRRQPIAVMSTVPWPVSLRRPWAGVSRLRARAPVRLRPVELDVRIGGVYALEGIARDSARDHPAVVEVLTAFVREHSREPWPPPDSPRTTRITWRGRFRAGGWQQERFTRPDVQAAVTALGRRDARRDIQPLRLNGADLTAADLRDANLGGADLTEATLRDADLTRTDLTGADLRDADLTRADLTGAFLGGADLTEATLAAVILRDADLTRARLFRADLTRADLGGATLTEVTLTGAKWPQGAPIPEGWKLSTRAGRLIAAADTDSGPPEVS